MLTSLSSSDTAQNEQGIVSRSIVRLLLVPIFVWQKAVSPFIGHHCRFEPTCSEYARQAFLKFGVIRGLTLTTIRICRCNPLCKGGSDPIP